MRRLPQLIALVTLALTFDTWAQESLCNPCVDPPVARDQLLEDLPIKPRTLSVDEMVRFLPRPNRSSEAVREDRSADDDESESVSGENENSGAQNDEAGATGSQPE